MLYPERKPRWMDGSLYDFRRGLRRDGSFYENVFTWLHTVSWLVRGSLATIFIGGVWVKLLLADV